MLKGFLLLGTPVPGLIGASEVEKGSSYGREVLDKAMVEVNKAYESLHISPVLQDELLMDSVSWTCGVGAELLQSGRELTTKVGEQPWSQLVRCASICCRVCGCVFQED